MLAGQTEYKTFKFSPYLARYITYSLPKMRRKTIKSRIECYLCAEGGLCTRPRAKYTESKERIAYTQ